MSVLLPTLPLHLSMYVLRKRSRRNRIVCALAEHWDVVREGLAVEVRRRQVRAPVDDVEDDERRREDSARHPVDVLRTNPVSSVRRGGRRLVT